MTQYKEYDKLSEKEKEIVKDSQFKKTEDQVFEDETLVREMIRKKEIVDIKIIKKFKILMEKKFEKIIEKVRVNFGESLSFEKTDKGIQITSDDKLLVTLDEEQSQNIIKNGFEDKTYVNVTGVCKREIWEKEEPNNQITQNENDRKTKIRNRIIAGIGVLIVVLPIVIGSCNKQIENDFIDTQPIPTVVETQTIPDIPGALPIEPDYNISQEYIDEVVSVTLNSLSNVEWIPYTTQQTSWSLLEDYSLLSKNSGYTPESINRKMTEDNNTVEAIHNFKKKYEGKSLNETEFTQFLVEAEPILNSSYVLVNTSITVVEEAEKANEERIEKGLIRTGNLQEESRARTYTLSVLEENKNMIIKSTNNIEKAKSDVNVVIESPEIEEGKIR